MDTIEKWWTPAETSELLEPVLDALLEMYWMPEESRTRAALKARLPDVRASTISKCKDVVLPALIHFARQRYSGDRFTSVGNWYFNLAIMAFTYSAGHEREFMSTMAQVNSKRIKEGWNETSDSTTKQHYIKTVDHVNGGVIHVDTCLEGDDSLTMVAWSDGGKYACQARAASHRGLMKQFDIRMTPKFAPVRDDCWGTASYCGMEFAFVRGPAPEAVCYTDPARSPISLSNVKETNDLARCRAIVRSKAKVYARESEAVPELVAVYENLMDNIPDEGHQLDEETAYKLLGDDLSTVQRNVVSIYDVDPNADILLSRLNYTMMTVANDLELGVYGSA